MSACRTGSWIARTAFARGRGSSAAPFFGLPAAEGGQDRGLANRRSAATPSGSVSESVTRDTDSDSDSDPEGGTGLARGAERGAAPGRRHVRARVGGVPRKLGESGLCASSGGRSQSKFPSFRGPSPGGLSLAARSCGRWVSEFSRYVPCGGSAPPYRPQIHASAPQSGPRPQPKRSRSRSRSRSRASIAETLRQLPQHRDDRIQHRLAGVVRLGRQQLQAKAGSGSGSAAKMLRRSPRVCAPRHDSGVVVQSGAADDSRPRARAIRAVKEPVRQASPISRKPLPHGLLVRAKPHALLRCVVARDGRPWCRARATAEVEGRHGHCSRRLAAPRPWSGGGVQKGIDPSGTPP